MTPALETLESRRLLAAGALDTTFGSGGMLMTDFPRPTIDAASGVAVQRDGRYVVAGSAVRGLARGDEGGAGVARYLPDGSLDPTFGRGGTVVVGVSRAPAGPWAVAVQRDGKILLAGRTTGNAGWNFAILRLNADGTPDATFGTGGMTDTDFSSGLDQATSIAVQPDGRIVVGGFSKGLATSCAITRYTANGLLDKSFGNRGRVQFAPRVIATGRALSDPAAVEAVRGLAIAADGSILAAANSGDEGAVVRLTPAGTFDAGFGSHGVLRLPALSTNAIESLRGGGIVVAGARRGDFAAARLDAAGRLDPAFGRGGIARLDLGGDADEAHDVLVAADKRLLLVGTAGNVSTGRMDFAVARLNADGSADAAFGDRGSATLSFDRGADVARAGAILPDGSIVAVGSGRSGDFQVGAFDAAGDVRRTVGRGGRVVTPLGLDQSSRVVAVARQASGRLLLAVTRDTLDEGAQPAIHALNADGTPDTTWGDDGTATSIFDTSDLATSTGVTPTDLVVLPDGRVAVVGTGPRGGTMVALLTADGRPDTSFDGDGTSTLSFAGASGAAIYHDDALIVTGADGVANWQIYRVLLTGRVDASFGIGGEVVIPVAPDFPQPNNYTAPQTGRVNRLAVQADGKIVAVGYHGWNPDFGLPPQNRWEIVRLTAGGQRDTTFGNNGLAVVTFTPVNDVATGVAIQPDGKILVGGGVDLGKVMETGSPGDFGVSRLNPDGSLDTTFGAGGKVRVDFAGAQDEAADLFLQADGKILIAGTSRPGSPGTGDSAAPRFAVARLTANGTLDTTYDGDGRVLTPIGDFAEPAAAALVQPDGRLVLAGTTGDVRGNLVAVARYEADAPTADRVRVEVVNGTLVVTGTPGDDVIDVLRDESDGHLYLDIQGDRQVHPGPFSRIVFKGLAGDDAFRARPDGVAPPVNQVAPGDRIPVILDGGAGNDLLGGGQWHDVLLGGPGDDTLDGGGGDDTLFAHLGNDLLQGNAGNDYLNGGPGADRVFGGAGNDQIFSVDSVPDTIDGDEGFDRVKADANDVLRNTEGLLA